MESMRNGPYRVLVALLLVCMADMYRGQRIDLVKDSCTGPDEIELLRKELVVLSQVVKDQAIRIDIMEKALTSVKQECCQQESLLSSSESSPTSTVPTTKPRVISTTTIQTTQMDETTESSTSIGNTGRKFLMLFMANSMSGDLRIYVTTKHETFLNISSSDDLSSSIKSKVDRTTTVISESNFTLPTDLMCGYIRVEPKAVLLQTTKLSAVTAFSLDTFTTDGALIIPTDKLSTKYLVSTTEPYNTGAFYGYYSQFAIGALYDMSNVNIKFKMNNTSRLSLSDGEYTDGDVYSITLKRLETFQIKHNWDLTGTLITSSKPIAVFSGNRCQIFKPWGSCSHMVTQLPPVNQLDDQYIVPTFHNNVATLIQIVSEHKNIIFATVEGGQSTWYLDERDFKDVEVTSNETTILVSDHPVLVSSFGMGGIHDPYMTVIPGVHQYLEFYKITVPAGYTENYMSVIIPLESKNNLRINGLHVNISSIVYASTSVLFTTTYVVQTFEVKAGTFVLSTTDHSTFALIVYGHRYDDGYSFAGNFLFP